MQDVPSVSVRRMPSAPRPCTRAGKPRGSPTRPAALVAAPAPPPPWGASRLFQPPPRLGTGGGAGQAPTQRGPGLPKPRQQALPDSGLRSRGEAGRGPEGGIPAGIPTPTAQFVHFLPWLQISTISLMGHLRPLPAAWPCPDPGRGQEGPCPASSKFAPSHAFSQHPAERPLDASRGAGPECRGD